MSIIERAVDKAREGKPRPGRAPASRPVKIQSLSDWRRGQFDEVWLRDKRVILAFDSDERAEAYRQLRAQVLKKMAGNHWSCLAITSPNEGAGKTLTSVNLAIAIARDVNHTAILIDLDLRSPSVHDTLGLDTKYGLIDYLHGDVELGDIGVKLANDQLIVVPGRPAGSYSSELLSSPEMAGLISYFRGACVGPVLIFDLPPLLRNDDALLCSSMVDTTILIVEDGATTEADLRRSTELLGGSHVLGTVLNKVHSS